MAAQPMISMISAWGPTWAPRQWTLCAGQLLAISQFTAVFSLIGTIYGGDGRTTFQLPDLRNRSPVAAGQSSGTSFHAQGSKTGQESVTLTVREMPTHNHLPAHNLVAIRPASADPASEGTPDMVLVPAQIAQRGVSDLPNIYGEPDGVTTLFGGSISGTITLGDTGGGRSFSVVQPLQAIQFIFALEGIYPSRN
ncbi:Microcystin-dependent protein [Tistlia consotensis]|uniref:Microcystin-dependent protein n=1 Tax=Tistlia consotensis USBA 355 TaxID=560819 RepID=A0A1Y6CR16_9PROT|nr:tail fiber protein [Tistlia consotensis]SMF72566.1 Microcystin-dependent protein [Tistlia consotensis USBA 355]SNS09398.1 Microcystin-dependent protein [Tistlia consotensis]